ncbi:hypothetical protein GPECTOR_56g392 [Gonium pectorale]|uniref:Ankyrin repeat domain-containing protein n=1 Tax=Gonium pectorale TaxID=33097 RepID=A0A150G5Y2_GONPE|nr:hypothetical protein GPECTOR_56g392 [Gonium pectorale]|eukprot:KXZ45296.1 hypothetical protein GPECTOR_56g392 [Gonium pectorale]
MAAPIRGHGATTAARIWISSIVDRIACFLPRNEVACSLRVVDKTTAAVLRTPDFTTVRLSEPVPHHAFAWRWGRPGAIRELTLAQRRELLRLTAASGATANLAIAARAVACRATADAGYAAGKAGQVGTCAMLEELGCDMRRAVEGAAAGGHLALCEELTSWAGPPPAVPLQIGGPEWLESQGFPQAWIAFEAAAKRPDALERFAWLAQRRYPRRPEDGYGANAPLVAAAAAGNAAAVLFLAEGWPADTSLPDVWCAAAGKGHLHVLQALHAAGRCVGAQYAANYAARSGHLHVLAWLVETPGLGPPLDEELFRAAAESGSVELLAWLRERGCPWDERSFAAAARSGCEAALEWLAERGCPMPT